MSRCKSQERGLCAGPGCEVCNPTRCFEVDGARVQGDADMSPEARNALRTVIAAVNDGPCWTCGGRGCPDCLGSAETPAALIAELREIARHAARQVDECFHEEPGQTRACADCVADEVLPAVLDALNFGGAA